MVSPNALDFVHEDRLGRLAMPASVATGTDQESRLSIHH